MCPLLRAACTLAVHRQARHWILQRGRERDASWLSTQGRGLSRVDEALKSFWLLIGQCPFYASLSVTAQSMLHDHLGINEEVNGLCGPTGQRRRRWTILGPGTHAFSYALPKRDTTPQC